MKRGERLHPLASPHGHGALVMQTAQHRVAPLQCGAYAFTVGACDLINQPAKILASLLAIPYARCVNTRSQKQNLLTP